MDEQLRITVHEKEFLVDCSSMTPYDGYCIILEPKEWAEEIISIPHIFYLARPYMAFRDKGEINARGIQAIERSLQRLIGKDI